MQQKFSGHLASAMIKLWWNRRFYIVPTVLVAPINKSTECIFVQNRVVLSPPAPAPPPPQWPSQNCVLRSSWFVWGLWHKQKYLPWLRSKPDGTYRLLHPFKWFKACKIKSVFFVCAMMLFKIVLDAFCDIKTWRFCIFLQNYSLITHKV